MRRKEAVLDGIRDLLIRRDVTVPNMTLPWKALWSEAVNLTLREENKSSTLADGMISNVHASIVRLLHDCRPYIDEKEGDHIVEMAMEKLEDSSQPSCVEGLLLLVVCLPTSYKGYDNMLPKWLQIWDRLRHNSTWDLCWLCLFTRARKHANPSAGVWDDVATLLQIKTRVLLSLPGSTTDNAAMFPFKFPYHYEQLMPSRANKLSHAQAGITKVAKLLYFMTLRPCAETSETELVDPVPITLPRLEEAGPETKELLALLAQPKKVRAPVAEIVMLFQSLRPFFYASNTGPWTSGAGMLMAVFCSEIARHVGRNIAAANTKDDLGAHGRVTAAVLSGYKIFQRPLHAGTVRFLLGNLVAIAMEGIYSKGQMMQQLCSMTMKNIVAVDPTLGHVIVPFLLQALNPKAVSQSHQAPAAMVSLAVLIKPLLYPCPVLTPYLPDLLALSLPGIDPNDVKKSLATLKMYTDLLGALPIRSQYGEVKESSFPPPYLSLTNAQDAKENISAESSFGAAYARVTDPAAVLSTLTNVSAAFETWAPHLLERIFILFEAMEAPKKGTSPSPVANSVERCIQNLFLALEEADGAVKASLENKVIDYFASHNPANAAKICAKVLGKVVEFNPTLLSHVIDKLATEEVLQQHCSKDRLAFRLRLLAGAARNGAAEVFKSMDVWKHLTAPAFVYNTDKSIRKASIKLLKELLRGTIAFYPIVYPTLRGAAGSAVLGGPVNRNHLNKAGASAEKAVLEWYEPSAANLSIAATLMRNTANAAMAEIRADLAEIKGASADTGLDVKKVEDHLAQRLKLVSKVLKGAAEVLGDEGLGLPDFSSTCTDSTEPDFEGDNPDKNMETLASSGPEGLRKRLHEALERTNAADATYFKTFRADVLGLLLEIRTVLRLKQPPLAAATGEEDKSTGDKGVPVDSLGNSSILYKYWAKTLNFVIRHRACATKSMDLAKRWHGLELNGCRSVLVKAIRKFLSLRHGRYYEDKEPLDIKQSLSVDQWRALVSRKAYWDTHDVPVVSLVRRVFIQYYLRLLKWMSVSMRRAMWSPVESCYHGRSALMAALNFLIDICCHEYDAIRTAGQNTFSSVIGTFGAGNYIIRRLLSKELNANNDQKATFGSALGAMKLLQRPFVMRRVLASWSLSTLFFDTLRAMPALTAQIEADEEKKEKLVGVVAATFVHYIPQWFYIPAPLDTDVKDHLLSALDKVGYGSETVIDVDSTRAGGSGGGIRFETFNSYVVMATIGHPDVEVPAQAWTWALRTVATAHGQPNQQLAYTALCRLAALHRQKSHVLQRETDAQVRSLLACTEENTGIWSQLLQGLSAVHPKSDRDGNNNNPQWSGGVDTALKWASTYSLVSSHKRYSLAFEHNIVSPYFQREASVLYLNLFSSSSLGLASSEGPVSLGRLLSVAKESLRGGASDQEARTNNATHSELFGGLLRTVLESESSPLSLSLVEELLKHYEAATEKISFDFARDWDEALLFACSGPPTPLAVPFLKHVVAAFKQMLETSGGGKSGDESDEGFNKEGKKLFSLAVVSRSRVTSSWQRAVDAPICSDIDRALASDLAEAITVAGSGVISPYRTSRTFMVGILRSLLLRGPLGSQLEPTQLKGLFGAIIACAEAGTTTSDGNSSDAGGEDTATSDQSKNALDMMRYMLDICATDFPIVGGHAGVSVAQKEALFSCIVSAVRCVTRGCGHGDIETATLCHKAIRTFVAALRRGEAEKEAGKAGKDELGSVIRCFPDLMRHESFRVRVTVIEAAVALMAGNWPSLLPDEKVLIKETLTAGFSDTVPEVQQLAQAGFSGYLGFKTDSELRKLSESFCRNSDKYVAIEKQRKRKASESGTSTEKADKKFIDMVNMMCCIVKAAPYDLPSYVPHLLTCLVRHASTPVLKEPISKTVLEFKRTHQDRWLEFKELFSAEQLDSLLGATHLSYLS